jgi:hypothetical protein
MLIYKVRKSPLHTMMDTNSKEGADSYESSNNRIVSNNTQQ